MKIAPIRTQNAYEASLSRARELAGKNDQGSIDELEILSAVLERWEREKIDLPPPESLSAIRFRMRQSGLKPRDLEPFIGSRARVSEILSGVRPLTLDMMRALHRHLGIPAAALLGAGDAESAKPAPPSSAAFGKLKMLGAINAGEDYHAFVARAFCSMQPTALLRKSRTDRTNAKTDNAALTAWCGAVMLRANATKQLKSIIQLGNSNIVEAARKIAKLSTLPDGPIRARDLLLKYGIILIIFEHLPGTYLDGAAMLRSDGASVIAMTLRHDRIDNFWFTLLHEFCHAVLHLRKDKPLILDDLELKSSDENEAEADSFAQNALIPASIWDPFVSPDMRAETVHEIAAAAEVHPAIVAGRWQREHNDYRRFSKMLGRGSLRSQFSS